VRSLVALSALVLIAPACGTASHRTAASALHPKFVGDVPTHLPAAGVRIQDVVLEPWASTPRGAMSARQAIKAARKYANAQPFRAKALQADVTLPGTKLSVRDAAGQLRRVNTHDVPSWVVTFTSSKPIDVNVGSPQNTTPIYVTHFSVVLSAVTRVFVSGFFTR
jgi:hypothetical protein